MTRTEQAVNRVMGKYTPKIQAEREAMAAEIIDDQNALEKLRVQETQLRKELVAALAHLEYNTSRAAFRIETREWADGEPALDIDFEHMKDAAEALTDMIADIEHASSQIIDKQCTLDDAEAWEEGAVR